MLRLTETRRLWFTTCTLRLSHAARLGWPQHLFGRSTRQRACQRDADHSMGHTSCGSAQTPAGEGQTMTRMRLRVRGSRTRGGADTG
eukprot:1941385-Rhodomonas_salina.2